MSTRKDPSAAIRESAAALPGAILGLSCNQSSFKVGKTAYLYIGPGAKGLGYKAMFKLSASLEQAAELAAKEPDRFGVGKGGWVSVRFTDAKPLAKTIWLKWLKESYALATGGATRAKKAAKKKKGAAKKKASPKKIPRSGAPRSSRSGQPQPPNADTTSVRPAHLEAGARAFEHPELVVETDVDQVRRDRDRDRDDRAAAATRAAGGEHAVVADVQLAALLALQKGMSHGRVIGPQELLDVPKTMP